MITSAAETPSEGTVRIERDRNKIGMPGQRLIDGVVHHLVDHMVKAGTVVGVADIHARPLADGIQPLQNLDGIGTVLSLCAGLVVGRIAHEILSSLCRGGERSRTSRIERPPICKI
jgi:hypothetical protein